METEKKVVPSPNIYQRLLGVAGSIGKIEKAGRNDFAKYNYITEADVMAHLKRACVENGLMIIPTVEECERMEKANQDGKIRELVKVKIKFSLVNVDLPSEMVEVVMYGYSADTGDKAIWKAITGAYKYFAMKLFMLGSGDDPENEKEDSAPKEQWTDTRRTVPKQSQSVYANGATGFTPDELPAMDAPPSQDWKKDYPIRLHLPFKKKVKDPNGHQVDPMPTIRDTLKAAKAKLSKEVEDGKEVWYTYCKPEHLQALPVWMRELCKLYHRPLPNGQQVRMSLAKNDGSLKESMDHSDMPAMEEGPPIDAYDFDSDSVPF